MRLDERSAATIAKASLRLQWEDCQQRMQRFMAGHPMPGKRLAALRLMQQFFERAYGKFCIEITVSKRDCVALLLQPIELPGGDYEIHLVARYVRAGVVVDSFHIATFTPHCLARLVERHGNRGGIADPVAALNAELDTGTLNRLQAAFSLHRAGFEDMPLRTPRGEFRYAVQHHEGGKCNALVKTWVHDPARFARVSTLNNITQQSSTERT